MPKSRVLSGLAIFSGVALLASGLAIAQDPIAKRKAYMKSIGAAAKTGGQMVKGEVAFDAKKAGEVMSVAAKGWDDFVTQFPDTAKTGGETTAHARIWSQRKDFEDKGAAFKTKVEAAAAAAAKGEGEFKKAYSAFVGSCKGCHEVYRIPR